MSFPALLSLSQRLTSTSSLLLERSRVLSLNLPPSASSQNAIVRNLTAIKNELAKLEEEHQLDVSGSQGAAHSGRSTPRKAGTGGGKGKEGDVGRQLREAGEQYDRLLDMFAEDDVGRERAKALRRRTKEVSPPPAPGVTSPNPDPFTPEPIFTSTLASSSSSAPAHPSRPGSTGPGPLPRVHVEPPTPATNPHMPFRDYPDGRPSIDDEEGRDSKPYEDERDEREILDSQQMMMQDQDDRLNLLSSSIGRQNHLSIQIGSELDTQHELLEDVDGAMDRTAARLGGARRRLDNVANNAKQHGSTVTIVILIVILLLLIIVFKT